MTASEAREAAAWHRGMAVFHREPNSCFQQLHAEAADRHDRAAVALAPQRPVSGAPTRQTTQKRSARTTVVEATGDLGVLWRAIHEWISPQLVLTQDRADLLLRWLSVYPVDRLVTTVSGYAGSEFHRGKNERKTRYLALELVFRDAQHIEAGWDLRDSATWRDPRRRPAVAKPAEIPSPVKVPPPILVEQARKHLAEFKADPANVPSFLRDKERLLAIGAGEEQPNSSTNPGGYTASGGAEDRPRTAARRRGL